MSKREWGWPKYPDCRVHFAGDPPDLIYIRYNACLHTWAGVLFLLLGELDPSFIKDWLRSLPVEEQE